MNIEYLNWDSEFFDKKIGKITITDNESFNLTDFLNSEKDDYDLIYIFSTNKIISSLDLLNNSIELKDIIVTMIKPFTNLKSNTKNYNFINTLNQNELSKTYDIVEQTSAVSRFFNDSNIGHEKTKKLYRKWIDNALNKSYSDGIFVEKDNDEIIGVHVIKTLVNEKIGLFTLTGVDVNYKRMGIGSKLWQQSYDYWSQESLIEIIKSPFSLQNKESLNFHLKMGFNKVEEIKYIYHYSK